MTDVSSGPLASIVAVEAAAFRLGVLGRRLITEHPDLSVSDLMPTCWAFSHGSQVKTELEVDVPSAKAAEEWAHALGSEAVLTYEAVNGYRTAKFTVVIDGITVKGTGVSILPPEAAEQAEDGER